MDTQYARHTRLHRRAGGAHRLVHDCEVIADEGRQETRGSELPVRGSNPADRVHVA
jgi:hypothetical protein